MSNMQYFFIKTLFRNLIDNKVSVIYRHSIDGYCIQGYFHPVIFSPFFTCKWFHPVLNSPKQSFFLWEIIWDIGVRPVTDNDGERGKKKNGGEYFLVYSILKKKQ